MLICVAAFERGHRHFGNPRHWSNHILGQNFTSKTARDKILTSIPRFWRTSNPMKDDIKNIMSLCHLEIQDGHHFSLVFSLLVITLLLYERYEDDIDVDTHIWRYKQSIWTTINFYNVYMFTSLESKKTAIDIWHINWQKI